MREAVKGLSDAEAAKLNKGTAEKFLAIRRNLPSAREMSAVAQAGQSKKGWYRNSTQALQEVFGDDAPRFTALLAAMSPQTSVESNLINALETWKNWTNAGRPTDRDSILDIMGESVEGDKGRESVLDAWVNNSLRALQTENPSETMLSGPKVDSFMRNLSGVMNEVTNDTWMARYGGVPQTIFGGSLSATDAGKGPGYLAMNSKVRDTADRLSQITGEQWDPAEVQETVWSWAYGLRNRDKGARIMDNLQQLRDPDVAAAPDFGQLLQEPKYAGPLSEAGYDEQLGALAERPSIIQPGSEEFTRAALERDPKEIRRAARRLALGFGERPAAALATGAVGAGALGGAEEAEAGPIQWAKRMTDDDLLEEMDYLTKQGKEDSTDYRVLEDEYNVRTENASLGPYEDRPESWRVMDPEGYDPEVHAMLESHGFVDYSWHNDGAPKFFNPRTKEMIWINYKDPDKRDFAKDEPRFMVETWDDDEIGPLMAPVKEDLSTDNPQELITRIQRAAPPVAAGALGTGALTQSEDAEAGTVSNIFRTLKTYPDGSKEVEVDLGAGNSPRYYRRIMNEGETEADVLRSARAAADADLPPETPGAIEEAIGEFKGQLAEPEFPEAEAALGPVRELTQEDFDQARNQRVMDKIANMGGGADEQFLENELDMLIRDTLSPSGEYDYMADPYPPEEWGDRLRDLSARMRQGELAPELQQAGLRSPEVANIVDQIAEGFDAEVAEVVPEGANPAEYGAEYLRGVYEQSFPAWGSQARGLYQDARRQPTGQVMPFPGPGTTGAIAGAAGLGALAAPEEAEAAPFGTLRALSGMPTQRVYHGSPAEFDTFRMGEMGTGEGAQAYGEGLYFSSSPDVAESYRDTLTSENAPQRWLSDSGQAFDLNEGGDFDRAELINFALEGADGDVQGALRNLEWYEQNVDDMVAMGANREESVRAYREAADELRRMQAEGGDILRRDVPEGSLFEVEVPAREQLLDYDLPLREQPEQVRGALGNLLESQLGLTGEEYYKRLGEGASGRLREMGVPGLTYRGLESGEQNVVMFDENLINAVSRNEAPISRGMTGFAEEEVELGLPDEPEWMGRLANDQAGFATLGPMATAGGIGALAEPSISDEFIGAGKAAGSLANAMLTGLGAEGAAFLSAINPMFSTEQALEQAARARAVQPRLTDDPRAAPYLQGFVGALDTAVEDVARGFGKQSPLYQNVAPYRGLYDFAEEDLPALYERLPRRLRLALESGANIAF